MRAILAIEIGRPTPCLSARCKAARVMMPVVAAEMSFDAGMRINVDAERRIRVRHQHA
jgi:hypothetical protein